MRVLVDISIVATAVAVAVAIIECGLWFKQRRARDSSRRLAERESE